VSVFLAHGCSVYDLKQPVDLLVGANGKTLLVEIKDGAKSPSRQKYTKAQVSFMATWKGSAVSTVRDVEGAMTVARMLSEMASTCAVCAASLAEAAASSS
jgi:hypothetical protein